MTRIAERVHVTIHGGDGQGEALRIGLGELGDVARERAGAVVLVRFEQGMRLRL
jgi:hypothetical protein